MAKSILRHFIVFLEGVLLGLISIGIPGFSASTIAIIIGVYTVMVEAMANIVSDFKRSIIFLICLYLGYGIGSMLAALSVNILFKNFPLATVIVILGLLAGSIPDMVIKLKGNFKKISCWITFVIVGASIVCYNFFAKEGATIEFPEDPSWTFVIAMGLTGLVTSATFVIPGVDFAVVFLSLGLYYPFSNMLATLANFTAPTYAQTFMPNFKILLSYTIGYFTGAFLLSKLVKMLIHKFNPQTMFASFSFIAVAPAIVIKNCVYDNENFSYSTSQLIVGLILGILLMSAMILIGIRQRKKDKLLHQKHLEYLDERFKVNQDNVDELYLENTNTTISNYNNKNIEIENEKPTD